MDCSMPGFLVLHYLPEFAQTHVHWVSDAIQPSHPLCCHILLMPSIFPSIRVFSQLRVMSCLFTSGGQHIGASTSASVLPVNIQGWCPLGLTGLTSLLSKGLKNLLQHQNSRTSILWYSAFFIVQLSHHLFSWNSSNLWCFLSCSLSFTT